MADAYLADPDVGFIEEIERQGGGDLKKCYQCATCSVACTISPDNKPFPRKEMIAASWGLKDRLVADHDIWLCHNCGDCTARCPRGAKPGDVLGAVRAYAVAAYAVPGALARAVNDPKKLPILLAVPAVLILVVGFIMNAVLGPLFGITFLNFSPGSEEVAQGLFIHTSLVDVIMIPTFLFAVVVFLLGIKRFLTAIHEHAMANGKAEKKPLDYVALAKSLVPVIPTILAHRKFNECVENKDRSTAHLLVLFSFIALFIVTSIFFVALYILGQEGPYSQLNPVKWLANIAGVALITGAVLLLNKRLGKTDQVNSYRDWYLLGLVLALGVTGLGTEITRLAGWGALTYTLYYIHLMFVFTLFAYTPFSKLAHLAYRTVALTYDAYIGRK